MPVTRLLAAATSLILLASCASSITRAPKPIVYQGRVLTGTTEFYRAGYRAPSVSEMLQQPKKKTWLGRPAASTVANQDTSGSSRKGWPFSNGAGIAAPTISSGATHSHGTVFANPDGTTSRVEYGAMVRSNGTKDWIIGNSVFHANGTRSRIVGDTLIGPDGTRSKKVN
jgi:hypothetical protein